MTPMHKRVFPVCGCSGASGFRCGFRCDAALDQLIPKDHRVRAVWAFVDALDLKPLYQKIRAVEGLPGRDAVDPRILLAPWMFATMEGVSSARQLQRLTERDLAYLCGFAARSA